MLGAELLLLAVTDDAETIWSDARGYESLLGGIGAIFAEREVVFNRTTLVAISADDYLHIWMRREEARVLGNDGLGVGTELVAVIVEEDRRNVLAERGFVDDVRAGGIAWRWRRRRIDGNAGSCIRGGRAALRHQVIVGGVEGVDGLRAFRADGAESLDHNFSSV